jgi:hypothetical protein
MRYDVAGEQFVAALGCLPVGPSRGPEGEATAATAISNSGSEYGANWVGASTSGALARYKPATRACARVLDPSAAQARLGLPSPCRVIRPRQARDVRVLHAGLAAFQAA